MNIMIAYDNSRNARKALDATLEMFGPLKPLIMLIGVVEETRDTSDSAVELYERERREFQAFLQEAAAKVGDLAAADAERGAADDHDLEGVDERGELAARQQEPADHAAENHENADNLDHTNLIAEGLRSSGTAEPPEAGSSPATRVTKELFWLSELLRQTKGHPDEKLVRP